LAVDYRFEDWAFAVLDDDLNWFQEHLPVPNNVRGGRALCWFRPEAREVISRAWQMAKLVESAGIPVRVYRKVRPGTVVYEATSRSQQCHGGSRSRDEARAVDSRRLKTPR